MVPPESGSHSFIVRLWFEDAGEARGPIAWRGQITHVPSGARRYFTDLREIEAFIGPFLGAEQTRHSWWRRWWPNKRAPSGD